MEATLCLKAPHSAFLWSTRNSFHRCRGLRRATGFSRGGLCSAIAAHKHSSPPPADIPKGSKTHKRGLASVVGAAGVAVALACAVSFIGPIWSRPRRALAATWYGIPIQGSADLRSQEVRPDSPDREKQRAVQKVRVEIRQQSHDKEEKQRAVQKVLVEMMSKLPRTPNYPEFEEYMKDQQQLWLGDPALETLLKDWEKLQGGPEEIETGLLLVDICISKGSLAAAASINRYIIDRAPESDPRPQIRRAIIDIISIDWKRIKEEEKKQRWKRFEQEMQKSAETIFFMGGGPE